MQQEPILYSLQHCPYAIRARLGILLSQQRIMVRAIDLKNKPEELNQLSPTSTVPLLIVDQHLIIDESLDIMLWALGKNDPEDLLISDSIDALPNMLKMIECYDTEFKSSLEGYKSAKRYHDVNKDNLRQQCESHLVQLEQRLTATDYIMGENVSLVDYAILPFIRQFARVERRWYLQSPYPNIRQWLNRHLQSAVFSKAMTEYPLWLETHKNFVLTL